MRGYKRWVNPTGEYIGGKRVPLRIYNIYRNMLSRCNNSDAKDYQRYGGRGIKICSEWENSYDCFYEWAMNNGYQDDLTIDRIDVNGDYEPNNCRWVDRKTQARNRRNNVIIEGKTIAEIAEERGLNSSTLYRRHESGIDNLLEKRDLRAVHMVNGKSLSEIAVEHGLSLDLVRNRYQRGARTLDELIRPLARKKPELINGKTLKQLAEETGIKYHVIYYRYKKGIRDIKGLCKL